MAELRAVDRAEAARRLASIDDALLEAPAPDDVTPTRWAYREAAALLGWFEAGSLKPSRMPASESDLSDFLSADCERVATGVGSRWALSRAVRLETLSRLRTPKAMLAALEANEADVTDVGREMATAYLRKKAPRLEDQTLDQLHGTLQAIDWLEPARVALPSPDEVRGQIGVAGVLQPLRVLLDDGFVGREAELKQLGRYVEVGRRRLRRATSLEDKPPLVIHGPGGIGKSTLLAKFVVSQADVHRERRFPFAYLTFDRADLVPGRPLSLLAEAIHQLGLFFPVVAQPALELEQVVRSTVNSRTSVGDERRSVMKASRRFRDATSRDQQALLKRYGTLVDEATDGRELPNLWILDTLEQAQRQGETAMTQLWAFLDELQGTVTGLRVVFAGRASIEGHVIEDLELKDLDDTYALTFLTQQTKDLRVSQRFLRSVMRQIGHNPLSLKLAAELLRREGQGGLRKLSVRRKVLAALPAEDVQGRLYARILDHLDDEDLQKIANPGLVVRRLTADVIAQVLAGPCALGPVDENRARELFDKLKREASLVIPAGDDAVVHRKDVRRAMLPLLAKDDADKVRAIHEAAVAYYATKTDLASRTEELYHRLALGQSTVELDKHWDEAAGALLHGDCEDELPASSQVYLANKVGERVDPSIIDSADNEAWAAQAASNARDLIDDGRPADALALLEKRDNTTVRPLTVALRVEALAITERQQAALDLVTSSLTWADEEGRSALVVELLSVGARIAEDMGDFDRATKWAGESRDIAQARGDRVAALSSAVTQVRLMRRTGRSGTAEDRALRAEVYAMADALTQSERSHNPSLVRDLAAELGDEQPELLAEAAKLVGVDVEGKVGEVIDEHVSAEQRQQFESGAEQTVQERGRRAAEFLQKPAPDTSAWRGAIKDVFQTEADQRAY
jgi:hypothetical protein